MPPSVCFFITFMTGKVKYDCVINKMSAPNSKNTSYLPVDTIQLFVISREMFD